jgi:hypothetical protein
MASVALTQKLIEFFWFQIIDVPANHLADSGQ